MKWILKTIATCLYIFSLNVSATPPQESALDIKTASSVDEAVTYITATLQQQKYEVLGVVNHQQNAANVGLTLRPTQVILFRNRAQERILTRRSRTVAIDLPFKILVYEDDSGEIKLKTNDIGYYIDRHEIPIRDSRLQKLDATFDQFGLNDKGLVHVKSQQSVSDTIAKLRSVLEAAGFFIPFEINFNKRENHPSTTTLLIFGNPNVGTLLMQNQQEIGIDLPQKFLVYKGRQGETHIIYNNPRFIAKRAGIQGLDTLLSNVTNALGNFAQQGSQP